MSAVKSYLGHSLGCASGDQINATLGMWKHGILPGIATVEEFAGDVRQEGLAFSTGHRQVDPQEMAYAVVNSKGFGGNNASATLLSPVVARKMLRARYAADEWQAWESANEVVRERQQAYDDAMIAGAVDPVYKFDHGVLHDSDVDLGSQRLSVGGQIVSLDLESPYDDMQIDGI